MRSPVNYTIISSSSQQHLIRLRYTKTECLHCKKHCPYKIHVIRPQSADEVVYEDIEIIIWKSCCQGTVLVCEGCIDLYMPGFCPHCYDYSEYYG